MLIESLDGRANLSDDQGLKELLDFLSQEFSSKLQDVLTLYNKLKTLEHEQPLLENQLAQEESDVREVEGEVVSRKDVE